MELEGPDVSGKSVDVDGRKRLYSFDDLDDEPPVILKMTPPYFHSADSLAFRCSITLPHHTYENTWFTNIFCASCIFFPFFWYVIVNYNICLSVW